MKQVLSWYVGIDWGEASHQVCLCDTSGEVRAVPVHQARLVYVEEAGQVLSVSRPAASAAADHREMGVLRADLRIEIGVLGGRIPWLETSLESRAGR